MTIENSPEAILVYPDSGYTIHYGSTTNSPTNDILLHAVSGNASGTTGSTQSSSIDAFIEIAKAHSQGGTRRPHRYASSLADRRLFQAATVMVTAASRQQGNKSSQDNTNNKQDTEDTNGTEQDITGVDDYVESQTLLTNLSPPDSDDLQAQLSPNLTSPCSSPTQTSTTIPLLVAPTEQVLPDDDESQTQLVLPNLSIPDASNLPFTVLPKKPRGRPKSLSTPTPTQAGNNNLPHYWCECASVYPDPTEIALALQDPGKDIVKLVNGVRAKSTTFPLIQRLCTKIYQQIQHIYKPDGLTKNTTRGRESLAGFVIMARKLTDVANVDAFFHQFANKNGLVYIISNTPKHSGLDIPVKEFQVATYNTFKKARASRTCNDGLRLALTLLDPKYRASVTIIMANKKDRTQADIAGDPVVHFFEKIVDEAFKNPFYRPPQPSVTMFGGIDETEYSSWDPNDPKIFETDRSAEWLLETWKVYIRKKYKTADESPTPQEGEMRTDLVRQG
jgi:hypothetical protein